MNDAAAVRRVLAGAIVTAIMLGLGTSGIRADEPQPDAVAALVAKIDAACAQRWKDAGATPAPMADDAEYLRRVYLDLIGKIPTVAEVREFLADQTPDKRRRVVDKLLESPAYVTNFTNKWRDILMPEANADFQVRFLLPTFEGWLRAQFNDNVPYDKLVREILTLPLDSRRGQRGALQALQQGQITPMAFYQAKQVAPENLAAATSRMFLGTRIECAQCHDHPFDAWKRGQFWSFAAFFAGLERQGQNGVFGNVRELADRRELAIPDSDEVVQARFLDDQEPQWRFRVGARTTLADWVVAKDNPYFSRTLANRYWAHFFGRGIVDPVDDFGPNNPPSHPQLLDLLSTAVGEQDFDLKFLIRAITASRAYQLTSRRTDPSQDDPALFARMTLKGLGPEQIINSLARAVGARKPYQPQMNFVVGNNNPDAELRELFSSNLENNTETPTTILQALAMMNGTTVASATDLNSSQTLGAIAEYPLMNTAERVEALFLATVSRKPTDQELSRLVAYIDQGGPDKQPKQALADVFWALLNSSEFMFNH